jgi:ABC-type polysaccharide/polyol phosphate transport system ATPase subunit
MQDQDNAVVFKNVTKKFLLQEDKTFKELLPNLLFGRSWAKEMAALDNVSFEIKKGEAVGIIGKNGSGKSTTLKLIAGVTAPSKGKVEVNGKVAPLIELGAGFHHELTGLENIYLNAALLGMHKKEIELVIDKIIEFSELKEFIDVPVKRYSSGMYMRLGFAIAIFVDAPILLIDEVLSVGDVAFQKKCMDYFEEVKKTKEKTIVFVSHSEESVKTLCDRVILLSHGKMIDEGNPDKIFKEYAEILKADSQS